MATLLVSLPRTASIRGFAALRTKQDQLRLRWQRAMAPRQEAARITRELGSYSNRELAELGLSRSEIPAVAHGTFGRK